MKLERILKLAYFEALENLEHEKKIADECPDSEWQKTRVIKAERECDEIRQLILNEENAEEKTEI